MKSPLFMALALGLLFAISRDDVRDIEHLYWNPWYKFDKVAEPGSAVIVSLDAGARAVSTPPIASTAQQARLITELAALGARHVYLDEPQIAEATHAGDAALRASLTALGPKVTLVNRAHTDLGAPMRSVLRTPRFAAPGGISTAFSQWSLNFMTYAVWSKPGVRLDGRDLQPVSMKLAGVSSRSQLVYPDFQLDPASIPVVDAAAVLAHGVPAGSIAGKDLFVTGTSETLDTSINYPGHGKVPMAAVDIAAGRALATGKGVDVWWQPFLLLFAAAIVAARRLGAGRVKIAVYAAIAVTLLVGPGVLRSAGYVTSPGAAWVALLVYAIQRGWQKWRERVRTTSSASGMPNIEALSIEGIPPGTDVVAVSVSHYEQMLASLPRELHGECARQIARRLSVAASGSKVYDNDNGYFVWLVQPYALDALIAQFEGLKALFSAPLVIGGHILDTNVHFGLDRNAASKPINRIRSAIVSSSEAQSKGKLYEEFGQQRLAEAPWELSLNARIDEALRNGDIWLAFQAQYDLRTDRIGGAETLIRWNDPERGVIPPDSFIIQAERAGRIDAITYWVLEKAIQASGDLDATVGGNIHLSVNLSAWMVDQPGLVSHISEIVRRSGIDCSRLTFEVTETFSMTNREVAKHNLGDLRAMGLRLSIDDFGTGQASLSYLSEIPSDEIKLDRRFIQAITQSKRDRVIVASTIQLAQALGQEIVAEGVEDLPTLRVLQELGCDIAQGYLIGRPVRFEDFVKSLSIMPQRRQFSI